MTKISKITYFIILISFFTIFDLYFSELILSKVNQQYISNPIIELIYVKNTGAAFSILENYQIFLVIFSIFIVFALLHYIYKNVAKISTLSLFWTGMLISGIICNLYERLVFGFVRDFFKLNFVDFPVFNISDIFINIGVIAIIITIIKNKYFKNNEI